MSYEIGSAYVQIIPSLSGIVETIGAAAADWGSKAGEIFAETFKEIVNNELKDMSAVKIDADTSEASAKAQALRVEIDTLGTKIDLGIDETDTQEKLAALQAELAVLEAEHPEIRIGVDTDEAALAFEGLTAGSAEAGAGLDELGAAGVEAGAGIDELGAGADEAGAGLDELGAGAGGASEGIGGIGAAVSEAAGEVSFMTVGVVALAIALVPIGGLFAGAFAAVPAILSGALAGVGALYAGLEPVISTIEAFSSRNAPTGGGGGSSSASTAMTNAAAQRNATYSVQQAQEALTNSEVNGAAAVTQAQEAAANATEAANNKVISANQTLISSEEAVTQAQFNEQQAQEAVVAARQAAANQLQDYTDQLADNAISAQQDALNLSEAQAAYQQATQPGSTATYDQQQQAAINLAQAQQAQQDLSDQNSQLQTTATAAFAAGVDGAQSVIVAENQLEQATQAVANAIQSQQNAQTAVTQANAAAAQQQITNENNIAKAQKDNAQGVSNAEKSLEQALANQKEAFAQAAVPVASGSVGVRTYAQDLAKLSPAGKTFVDFVETQLLPAFKGIETGAQNSLLPLTQAGLTDMLPFFKSLGGFIDDAAKGIGKFIDSLGKFAGSSTGLSQLQQMFANGITFMGDLATAADLFLQAFVGVGAQSKPIITALGDGIIHIAQAFLKWVNDGGFQGFLTWLQKNGPQLVADLESFVTNFGKLLVAVTPIGVVLDKVVGYVADFVGWLIKSDPLFLPVAAGIGAIALVVAALSSPIVLIVLGLTLLVLGVTLLATHWHEVWTNIKNWADDAWQYIDKNLFQPIENFFTKTIPNAFDSFVTFCKGLPKRALDALGDFASTVWGALVIGADWLDKHVWDPIESFFTGLPDKIGTAAEHMWDGVAAAFATVYDKIVGWWNDLTFSIQPIKFLGATIFPGVSVSTPNLPLIPIPTYHTGGVVQGTPGVEQLAKLMPGEIVTPAGVNLSNLVGAGAASPIINLYGVDYHDVPFVQKVVTDALGQFFDDIGKAA